MTTDRVFATSRNMQQRGGSFVVALGRALWLADEDNAARILAAFPELAAKYGPEPIPQPEVSDSDFCAFAEASK